MPGLWSIVITAGDAALSSTSLPAKKPIKPLTKNLLKLDEDIVSGVKVSISRRDCARQTYLGTLYVTLL